MMTNDYLNAAIRIGRRLTQQARWQDETCTWTVWRSQGASAAAVAASGEIYQGASGIGLFLGELFRLTGEGAFGRTAIGAISHALACVPEVASNHFGFYSGRVGIAAASARLGQILERTEFVEAADSLLEDLAGRESEDDNLDVLAGAAGAILALLRLRQVIAGGRPLEIASSLGEHLIRMAHREPRGWSWAVFPKSTVRNLAGFSHGAAGIGLALLELAAATGRDRYRFAAEMAFIYERQFFDQERDNWLDLRHSSLSELYQQGEEEVRRAVQNAAIEPYQPTCMPAWCHGSPGIGLSRLRAFEITGQAVYKDEALAALRSTLAGLRQPDRSRDFTLCHGIFGVCELPLEASRVLAQPDLREVCEWHGALGWDAFERSGRSWICGTMGQKNDPSLMVGEAGIGYFYLRLSASDVPSILCPRPWPMTGPVDPDSAADYYKLAQETVDAYFATTQQALDILDGESAGSSWTVEKPIIESPVEAAYQALKRRVDEHRGLLKDTFEDAFAVDRERNEMTLEVTDFTVESLRSLTRPTWREAMVWSARFHLADQCRLVTTYRDWTKWLVAHQAGEPATEPADGEATQLLFRRDNRIEVLDIGPLAEAILRALPATPVQIFERVVELIDETEGMPTDDLTVLVVGQIEQLYTAGFIDDETSPVGSTTERCGARVPEVGGSPPQMVESAGL